MARLLHITAHMGGGAGRFLSGYVLREKARSAGDTHRILLLEPPRKRRFVSECLLGGISVLEAPGRARIERELAWADIVVVHWWQHPETVRFLAELPPAPLRVVLWALSSGCYYPTLSFSLACLPHRTLVTSPCSYDNPGWTEEQREWARRHFPLIYALGRKDFAVPPPSRSANGGEFRIGYVGTLSESKLYPNFIRLCGRVLERLPDARFVLVGDPDGGRLEREAKQRGIRERFRFTGYSEDVGEWLNRFDVFGYPLNPTHYGTTENALLEAMANGLPAVAFRQCCEQYILEDGQSGFLVKSEEEYALRMEQLWREPETRVRLGGGARERVLRAFDPEGNDDRLRAVWGQVLAEPKRRFDFAAVLGKRPYEWFLSGLGREGEPFRRTLNKAAMSDPAQRRQTAADIRNSPPILRGQTKSSVFHFAVCFPEDRILQDWSVFLQADSEGDGGVMDFPAGKKGDAT